MVCLILEYGNLIYNPHFKFDQIAVEEMNASLKLHFRRLESNIDDSYNIHACIY